MSETLQSLGIDRLDRDQRIALVQAIWDSIAAETPSTNPPLLTEVQRAELQRRVKEADANPEAVIPWEEVKAQVLSRLKS